MDEKGLFVLVAGARPNFMKIAPLCAEMKKRGLSYEVFHSGQHYDSEMSQIFEDELSLDNVYHHHREKENPIENIQETMIAFRDFLRERDNVRAVIIPGDVNTSYACAITAKRMGFSIVHVEAGLRSYDISMPEELHRMTIDNLSEILFAPSKDAVDNLEKEEWKLVYMVGNIMIDSLVKILKKVKKHIGKRKYILVTIHRPENINNLPRLFQIFSQLEILSHEYEIVFPLHPHTRKCVQNYISSFKPVSPMGYYEFVSYMLGAEAVVTDSGGVQEETTFLGIPCFTVRSSTERPVTITEGTNKLVEPLDIVSSLKARKPGFLRIPKLWDGNTAGRIVDVLENYYA